MNDLFPTCRALPIDAYGPNYNKLRRMKLLMFSGCIKKFSVISLSEKRSRRIMFAFKHANRFVDIACSYIYEPHTDTSAIIKIEKSCLNRAIVKARNHNVRAVWDSIQFLNLYHSICYKVAANMDSSSPIQSNELNKKIIGEKIPLARIAGMSSCEMCPEKYVAIIEKINRMNQEIPIKYSTMYLCFKCKNRKTDVQNSYTRSWDEGTGIKVTCLVCGNDWSL